MARIKVIGKAMARKLKIVVLSGSFVTLRRSVFSKSYFHSNHGEICMRATDIQTFPALKEEALLLDQFNQRMLESGFELSLGSSNGNVKRLASLIRQSMSDYSEYTPFDSSRQMANHAWLRRARLHSDGRIAIALSFRNRWGTPLAGVTDCFEFFATLYRMAGPVLFECTADISTWTANSQPLIFGGYLLSDIAFQSEIQRLSRPGNSWLKHRLASALINNRGFRKQREPVDVAVQLTDVQADRYTFSVKLSGVAFPIFVDFKQGQLLLAFSESTGKGNQSGDITR